MSEANFFRTGSRTIRRCVAASAIPAIWVVCLPALRVSANDNPGAVSASARSAEASGRENRQTPGVRLARNHLPELLPVLKHLREHQPEQYERAVRDLDRAAKRLETQARRSEALHEASLKEWQSRSRIDLLKARLKVRRTDADRRQLVSEMQRLREVELERLAVERELLAEREQTMRARAAQLQQVIERLQRQIDDIDQRVVRLNRQSGEQEAAEVLRSLDEGREKREEREPRRGSQRQPGGR